MGQEALSALYEIQPSARHAIEHSAGYGVFSSFGLKMFFAGGTSGKGFVRNNRTKRHTYMRMVQVQGGLGYGVSKDRIIWVFETQRALQDFVDSGWEFGAKSNVVADIFSFSRSQGAFAGLALDGSVITVRDKWNEAYYGKPVSPVDILVTHSVSNSGSAELRKTVANAAKK